MDFSSLKIQEKVQDKPLDVKSGTRLGEHHPSIVLKGQQLRHDLTMYKKVYQGCDTCKKEIEHYIDGMTVICTGCESSYKLTERK